MINRSNKSLRTFVLAMVLAWTGIWIAGIGRHNTVLGQADCPNGPMFAELAAPAGTTSTFQGSAQFRERGNNTLMVRLNGERTAADTVMDVAVGGTVVGQITVKANGRGDLRLDSPGLAVAEGTAITVSSGGNVVLAGTFACVAGEGRRPNATPTPTVEETPSPTPTVEPTGTPTSTPTPDPTVTPTPDPTITPTPTVTPTPGS